MFDKINVLGGFGFIGSKFCAQNLDILKNDKYDYNVLDNSNVVYFISTVDNYRFIDDPYVDVDTNLITLIKTLESCKNSNVIFNFISSWFVYGNNELSVNYEDSICNPSGFYNVTKRTAELLLIEYCSFYNIKYRIIRLPNVLGETDTKVSKTKNVVQYLLKNLKNNEDISVVRGMYRDYMYVDDVVTAINTIITCGEFNTIYNVGSNIKTYLSELMKYAKEKLNSTSTINFVECSLKNPSSIMNVDKLSALNFKCKYNSNQIVDILLENI